MGRLERKKEKTKQAIVTAAVARIQTQGFDETTMEQIAEAADVAKGTLYNYFPSKEAIVSEWVRRTSREKNEARLQALPAMPDTRARMIAVFEAYVARVQAQKELFEKYVVYQMQQLVSFEGGAARDDAARSGLALIGREIVRLGQRSGELVDLPAHILADMFEVMFIEIVKQFYRDPDRFEPRRVIEQMVDLFLNGARDHEPRDR